MAAADDRQYVLDQGLADELVSALAQVVEERPADGLTRLANLLSDAAAKRDVAESNAAKGVQAPPADSDPVLALLSKRPGRQGKWFTVHQSALPTVEQHEEVCDIHAEFLQHHPNGGEPTTGFVAVRLNDEQIETQKDRIRISSYRWKDFKGLGTEGDQYVLPGNYLWFLEYVRERKLILWMDWMANVGVNVPVPEVIGYMGSLYAENIVLAEWMLDPDKVGVALSRTWMYQEMAFGPLDREAMGVLFERLRGLGRAVGEIPMVPNPRAGETLQPDGVRRSEQEDMAKVKAYALACGNVASLLTRRAFGAVAKSAASRHEPSRGRNRPPPPSSSPPPSSPSPPPPSAPPPSPSLQWFQAITGITHMSLQSLGVGNLQAAAAINEAKAELPGVGEDVWGRLLLLCSAQKGEVSMRGTPFDWTDGPWEAHREELLDFVCAAPYLSCKSLDELVQRYARGLLGAALGCEVSFESDRPEAITAVMRSIALTQYRVELSAAEVMERVWQSVLAEMAAAKFELGGRQEFVAPKVPAPILAGSSSFVMEPLQLHGTLLTYEQETVGKYLGMIGKLTCHYTTADGSVATFEQAAGQGLGLGSAVHDAGLRLQAPADDDDEKPLPKPQDAAGAEADICLCVPGAEALATTAKGVAFVLLTQPRGEGDRVISLRVVSKEALNVDGLDELQQRLLSAGKQAVGKGKGHYEPDMEGKPPRPDVRFYKSADARAEQHD